MIARRKALHRVWKANFVPLIASIFVKFPEIRGFENDDLVVMECESHLELEEVVNYLLARGLNMTRAQEDDYDVWLDFATGGTVVSLRPVNPS